MLLPGWKAWNSTDKQVWAGWIATLTVGCLIFVGWHVLGGLANIDSHPASQDFPPLEHVIVEKATLFAQIAGIVGFVQWLLLRTYIRRRSWWIPLWVVAAVVGWTGFLVLADQTPPGLSHAAIWIVTGIIIGALQWLVFRPYLPQAGWWMLAHLGAVILVLVIIAAINILTLIAGTLYGAFSGYAIVSLFRRAYLHDGHPTAKTGGRWSWRDTLSTLLFFGLIAIILIGYSYWRALWYLSPPPPPIFDSAAAVIEKTVGGRRNNESYVLVLRFPPPAGGHQEQIVVLEGYSKVFREPVDEFFFTLRSAQLSQEQAQALDALRKRWCQQPPTFSPLQPNEPFYDLGLWCSEAREVKDIHVPVDQLPRELEALKNVVAGPDTYE